MAEEVRVVRRLPPRRLDSCKKLRVRVGPSSTIRANHNVYSVHSLLIGENVEIRLYVERSENVLAFGNPGSGKTHLFCAIGQELILQGRRVLFTPCSILV